LYQQLQFETWFGLAKIFPALSGEKSVMPYSFICINVQVAQFALLQEKSTCVFIRHNVWVSVSHGLRITSGELKPQTPNGGQ